MKKLKASTFEQVMAARELVDKKLAIYEKALDNAAAIESKFPVCHNKLFRYKGKVYLVTCWEDQRDNSRDVSVDEVEE